MNLIADINEYSPSIYVFKTSAIFTWKSFPKSFIAGEDVVY